MIVRVIIPLWLTDITVSLIFSAAVTIFTCRKMTQRGRVSMHLASIPGKVIVTVMMILPGMDARCMLLRPRVAVFPQANIVTAAEKIRLTVMQAS